jgi:hypothetical protein
VQKEQESNNIGVPRLEGVGANDDWNRDGGSERHAHLLVTCNARAVRRSLLGVIFKVLHVGTYRYVTWYEPFPAFSVSVVTGLRSAPVIVTDTGGRYAENVKQSSPWTHDAHYQKAPQSQSPSQ